MNITTPPASRLIDQLGRVIDYIRLSITDRCDFRCQYCMAEDMQFLPRDQVLSLEEYARLVRVFVSLGVKKVRITGGEPLVRKNALWLFETLGELQGLRELTLTTNGSQLAKYASRLYQAGVRRINLSLDSLNAERFREITRIGRLSSVLSGIDAAQNAGLHIRLNVVLMRGINDSEAIPLIEFALNRQLDIAFIEEMPLGEVGYLRSERFASNAELLTQLQAHYALLPSTHETGGPARYWHIVGRNGRIGFISPHSHNFCGSCNRVRVSCKGELFLCLGHTQMVELKPLLRAHAYDDAPLIAAITASMNIKPAEHHFDLSQSQPAVVRFMSHTGG